MCAYLFHAALDPNPPVYLLSTFSVLVSIVSFLNCWQLLHNHVVMKNF